eukprot:Skav232936  [mRNA]  locus=scaffold1477:1155602:1157329:- [translate_table: standard]
MCGTQGMKVMGPPATHRWPRRNRWLWPWQSLPVVATQRDSPCAIAMTAAGYRAGMDFELSPSSRSPMKVLDPHCKPPQAFGEPTMSFASAQLSACLQRCLTPQSVPPGLPLPPGLAHPTAPSSPPPLPLQAPQVLPIEAQVETELHVVLRQKEGAERVAGQLCRLSGATLDATGAC